MNALANNPVCIRHMPNVPLMITDSLYQSILRIASVIYITFVIRSLVVGYPIINRPIRYTAAHVVVYSVSTRQTFPAKNTDRNILEKHKHFHNVYHIQRMVAATSQN